MSESTKGFPVTHGNAVSVYFKDPEGNGIEIFCDTPWHVPQPQVGFWDPSQDAEQVLARCQSQVRGHARLRANR